MCKGSLCVCIVVLCLGVRCYDVVVLVVVLCVWVPYEVLCGVIVFVMVLLCV